MSTLNVNKNFLVVGCGGLGCYIVENLLRLKAKSIAVCDADIFVDSNLNRQLYATPKNLGEKKVEAAKRRATELEFEGNFKAIDEHFIATNANRLLENVDIVIDALDNVNARFLLEDECAKRNIPIVHGAVGEWIYQVAVSMPGSNLLHRLYKDVDPNKDSGDTKLENYVFVVSLCAARQVAEAVKLALGEESELCNKVLFGDLKEDFNQVVSI